MTVDLLSRVQALVDALAYRFHGRPCKCPECQTARKLVSDAPALMEELRGRLEWRPIETAPKDGTRILGTDGNSVEVIYFADEWFNQSSEISMWCVFPPTHWMPLPPVPNNPNDIPFTKPQRAASNSLPDPDMPTQQLRLHMGELTTNEVLVARAALRWARSYLNSNNAA